MVHAYKDYKLANYKISSKLIPVGEAMLPFMTTKNGTSLSTSQLDFAVSRLQASIQRFNDGEITSHK